MEVYFSSARRPKRKSGLSGRVTPKPSNAGIGIAEERRGEIVSLLSLVSAGSITMIDARDSSFINWTVWGMPEKI